MTIAASTRSPPVSGFGAGVLAVALALASVCAKADETPPCPAPTGTVTIEAWNPPLTAHLADGRRVRLADLHAPEPPDALPVGPADLVALPEPDRWGRIVGDLVPKDTGEGLRASLVGSGLAFIEPAAMPEPCDTDLREQERRAERDRLGLWGRTPILDARQPGLEEHAGTKAFVVGTVVSVGRTSRTTYLNFGDDYRTDFTAMMDNSAISAWEIDPRSLQGVTVRVRGVLEAWNGGLIRVEHPAQIERGDFRAR